MHVARSTVISILVAVALACGVSTAAEHYQTVTVVNGGTISGRVTFRGKAPALPPQPVFKHQDRCGKSIPDERLLVAADGALRNVVVYLTDIGSGKAESREEIELDNAKCVFVPHVQTATVGQMLAIRNSDPFLHDAHAVLGERTLFNVAVPKTRVIRRPLAYTGLVHLNCNVRHTWMHAYIFVAEHPYHATTGADGIFTLTEVPAGTYTLTAWHEMLGSQDRVVTVEPGKAAKVEVEYRADESGEGAQM